MKVIVIFIFCSVTIFKCNAQKSLTVDAITLWHFKRYHIPLNTSITYKLKGSTHKETHIVADIQDSIIYIETGEAIRLDEIKKVIMDRSNFLTRITSSFLRYAGIGYVAIDAFNSAINGESPVFRQRVLLVGAALFTVGEIIHIANKKRIRIKKGTLKTVDYSFN